MTVDVARAAVIAGEGVVARYPGLLCVARGPDPEALTRLLEVCSGAAGADPGRILARRLARWLGGPDGPGDELVFGTLAAVGDRLGVFLVGGVTVTVPGGAVALAGVDAATWTDRLIRRPDGPVVLALAGAAPPSGLATRPNDLRAGVVPGAGAVLFIGPGPAVDPPASDHDWFADAPDAAEPGPAPPWVDRIPSARNGTTGHEVRTAVPVPAPANWHAEPPPPVWAGPGVLSGNGSAHTGRHAILEPRAFRPEAAVDVSDDRPDVLAGRPSDTLPGRLPDAGPARPAAGPVDSGPVDSETVDSGTVDSGPAGGHAGAQAATVDPPTVGSGPATGSPAARPAGGVAAVTAPGGAPVLDPGSSLPSTPPPTPAAAFPAAPPLPRRTSAVGRPEERGDAPWTPVAGSAPPPGRLVLDDGATFTVDVPYLVGRMPASDPRARAGELRTIAVDDDSGSVSRVHAEIQISGGDVVLIDSGSRNGTFVAGPDDGGWGAIAPGEPTRLRPGTRIRIGARTFVFEKVPEPGP